MQVPKYEWGGENFYAARIVQGQTDNSLRCVVIPSTTIDLLFTELPSSIHFIKCDVEGHELSCIKRSRAYDPKCEAGLAHRSLRQHGRRRIGLLPNFSHATRKRL